MSENLPPVPRRTSFPPPSHATSSAKTQTTPNEIPMQSIDFTTGMTTESETKKSTKIPNILKCRDDAGPIYFLPITPTPGESKVQPEFNLSDDSIIPAWAKRNTPFSTDKLRSRIEPWLTALCQSEHLSILIGSGLSSAVHRIATNNGLPGMAEEPNFGSSTNLIVKAAQKSAEATGRKNGNIEDKIRSAYELLRGMEILEMTAVEGKNKVGELRENLTNVLSTFAASVLKGEDGLIKAKKREEAFNYLVSFLMSFASRNGTRDRLHIFTTNYDRYIEAGAELAGMHLLDRFVGSLSPIFRSSRLDLDMHYNPPGIRGEPRYLEGVARFTKLHGSLDWVQIGDHIRRMGVPFGAESLEPFLKEHESADAFRLMIYPNAAKDRETAAYPYVELFRDLAAAACRPNHTLFAFGYSFGDEHINRVIEDMLTIPSTHLVIMSYNDPMGRIMKTYEKMGRSDQITLLVGDHVGDFQTLVENYLPKSAIDRTTFRMVELLKSRFMASDRKDPVAPAEAGNTVGGEA